MVTGWDKHVYVRARATRVTSTPKVDRSPLHMFGGLCVTIDTSEIGLEINVRSTNAA